MKELNIFIEGLREFVGDCEQKKDLYFKCWVHVKWFEKMYPLGIKLSESFFDDLRLLFKTFDLKSKKQIYTDLQYF